MGEPKKIQRKPVTLMSMQFDGENKQEFTEWVKSYGGEIQDRGSYLRYVTPSYSLPLHPTEWLVWEDDDFQHYTNDQFSATFKGVVGPRRKSAQTKEK